MCSSRRSPAIDSRTGTGDKVTAQIPQEVKIGLPPAAEITGALRALEYARTIVVSDQSSYELAASELQEIKARSQRIEAARVALKAPVLEAGRQIDAFFSEALEPLRMAETAVKGTMLVYSTEQSKIVAEAQRKAEEESRRARLEAERRAREEREKAEAESRRQQEAARQSQLLADEAAERARTAKAAGDREAAAKAEAERKRAEEDQRRAQAKSEKALENGEAKAGAAMEQAAQIAARPSVAPPPPSAKGVSTRSTWRARVTNLMTLVKAVAEGKAPLAALSANMKVLDQAAISMKTELSTFYPGVEPVEEKGIAASTKGR